MSFSPPPESGEDRGKKKRILPLTNLPPAPRLIKESEEEKSTFLLPPASSVRWKGADRAGMETHLGAFCSIGELIVNRPSVSLRKILSAPSRPAGTREWPPKEQNGTPVTAKKYVGTCRVLGREAGEEIGWHHELSSHGGTEARFFLTPPNGA